MLARRNGHVDRAQLVVMIRGFWIVVSGQKWCRRLGWSPAEIYLWLCLKKGIEIKNAMSCFLVSLDPS
jgi:hypothetical protein